MHCEAKLPEHSITCEADQFLCRDVSKTHVAEAFERLPAIRLRSIHAHLMALWSEIRDQCGP